MHPANTYLDYVPLYLAGLKGFAHSASVEVLTIFCYSIVGFLMSCSDQPDEKLSSFALL